MPLFLRNPEMFAMIAKTIVDHFGGKGKKKRVQTVWLQVCPSHAASGS
jgi:chemotaxis methyl-accepting protein methylase